MYRILILGDFSAHGARAGSSEPRPSIEARRVDRDDLDDAIAAFAPRVQVAMDPAGGPVSVEFKSLDDFHPDRLIQRLQVFRELTELRDRAASPSRPAPSHRPGDSSPRAANAALGLGGGSLLDRILDAGGDPTDPGALEGVQTAPDELSEFVRRAVEPHRAPERTAEQREIAAKVDGVITAALRVLLHDRQFQSVEALWRGVDLLTRRLDTGEDLELHLADVSRAELVDALSSDRPAAALRRLLTGRFDLVVAHYSFGPEDTALLARVASFARETGAPWIAAGTPAIAGAESFGDGSDSDDWNSASTPEWSALRRSSDATWLSIALPRVLARVSYGKATEPCETIAFEEIGEGTVAHESHLWGNPAMLCALLAGESAAEGEDPPSQGTVGGLPYQVVTVNGGPEAVPCAEALLSQRSVGFLLDRGLTPLASERDGDSVRVPRLQSIAYPPAPLARAPRR